MKKIFFVAISLSAVLFSVSSCTKNCNTCILNGASTDYCPSQYSQSQIDAFRTSCTNNGGTWQ